MKWLNQFSGNTKLWFVLVFGGIAFYECLEHLSVFTQFGGKLMGVLLPFLYGAILAYLLDVPVRLLQSHGVKKRGHAVFITLVSIILMIALLIWLVIPQLTENLKSFYHSAPAYLSELATVTGLDLSSIQSVLDNVESLSDTATELLSAYADHIMQYTVAIGSQLANVVTTAAFCIYALLDKVQLVKQMRKAARILLPASIREVVMRLYRLTDQQVVNFLAGKVLDSLIIGGLTALLFSIFQIPLMPLLSVIICITNIIPIAGPVLGGVVGGVILLLASPKKLPLYIIIVLVIQQLDGQFIGPKILGRKVGMSTLWTLFAIVVGGDLFGVIGLVLGVPLLSVLSTLFQEFLVYVQKRKQSAAQEQRK